MFFMKVAEDKIDSNKNIWNINKKYCIIYQINRINKGVNDLVKFQL